MINFGLRHPKTTSEKRANAALKVDEGAGHVKVKARVRTGKTRSRLADFYDDIEVAANHNIYRGKRNFSDARKAKEREKVRLLAA